MRALDHDRDERTVGNQALRTLAAAVVIAFATAIGLHISAAFQMLAARLR